MVIHVVQPGETVRDIARQYGVPPQRISSDNAIADETRLVVGQALVILQPETVHIVRAGETLYGIAQQYGTTVMSLWQNNPWLAQSGGLRPGDGLVVQFQGQKRRTLTLGGYVYPYVNLDILKRALPYLTTLTLFGYGFNEDGGLIGIDDQSLIDLAYQYQTAPVMLISSITEDGSFSSQRASLLFQNTELQKQVSDAILSVMLRKGYMGLTVDFEFIEADDAAGYLAFIEQLHAKLSPYGLFVTTDLAPKTSADQPGLLYEAHDYAAIGAASDQVLLMTYEWGYTYGPPMAVAPIDKVRQVVEYAVTEIPPEKILMGLPNYGYDWTLPYEQGKSRAISIGNQYAVELAARHGAEIFFDEQAQTPFFNYTGRDGAEHVVWFEDARSILAKLDLMDAFALRGGEYWNLMRPFEQNWALVNALYSIRKIV